MPVHALEHERNSSSKIKWSFFKFLKEAKLVPWKERPPSGHYGCLPIHQEFVKQRTLSQCSLNMESADGCVGDNLQASQRGPKPLNNHHPNPWNSIYCEETGHESLLRSFRSFLHGVPAIRLTFISEEQTQGMWHVHTLQPSAIWKSQTVYDSPKELRKRFRV